MIRSMTAFSRRELSDPLGDFTLEIRSVNHRYLDVILRLPEELRSLEPTLRERIAARLGRGKVEVNLRFTPGEGEGEDLPLDDERIRKIAHASRHIDSFLYNPAPVSSLEVLKMPGVIRSEPLDQARLAEVVGRLLDTALDDLVATREREGARLSQMLRERTRAMRGIVEQVQAKMPEYQQLWRERLLAKLAEVKGELDENRLEQEMVYFAQKTDVAEELDRLQVHLDEVERVLEQDKPVGRRLDFLMQELNREANTLGAKSIHAEMTKASVDLKVLIEQMREQVQNIE